MVGQTRSVSVIAIVRQLITGLVMRGFNNYRRDENLKLREVAQTGALDVSLGHLRIWWPVYRNPVNDGVVFSIRAVAYDFAVKILSDTPAGDVLDGHRIDETSFVESCVSPFNECGHDFPAKPLSVCAFLEPKAEFGRNRICIFKRGHAKAFPVVEAADDERKLVRFQ